MAETIIPEARPCKTCGGTERYKDGKCKSCVRDRVKRRADKIRESLRAYSRKWRLDNLEKVRAIDRARSIEYRKKNPEKRKAAEDRYVTANKERVAASRRGWKKRNPAAVRLMAATRRKRIASLCQDTRPTARDIRDLLEKQKGKCACCRCDIRKSYHIDHIFPLSKGGEHSKQNIQLLCPPCNLAKHAKHPVDFMQERGFLI